MNEKPVAVDMAARAADTAVRATDMAACYWKNSDTPHTAMIAPIISRVFIRCRNSSQLGMRINTGVSDMMVCAIPVDVALVAASDSVTPRNGPVTVAQKAQSMPFVSLDTRKQSANFLPIAAHTAKPRKPAMLRMQVALTT